MSLKSILAKSSLYLKLYSPLLGAISKSNILLYYAVFDSQVHIRHNYIERNYYLVVNGCIAKCLTICICILVFVTVKHCF
jgi:hypothetical protein